MFKKIAVVLLALWLLLCAALPVLAADTRIDTETPNWVSVALTIDGGKVRVNGSEYGNGEVVMIPYGSAATLEFISNNGKALKTVLLDGVDITALLADGRYELSGLIYNAALTVRFNAESGTNTRPPNGNAPGTGDDSNMMLWVLLGFASLTVLSGMIIADRKKKKGQTTNK
ncbi:MAG: LPXTG cell wall anchor domain-containing protein [Oscillospiraceae bacterium]|nr:LPXTG cell wall anchor domain-containing protein [Oscillospiraceae bacterium]